MRVKSLPPKPPHLKYTVMRTLTCVCVVLCRVGMSVFVWCTYLEVYMCADVCVVHVEAQD